MSIIGRRKQHTYSSTNDAKSTNWIQVRNEYPIESRCSLIQIVPIEYHELWRNKVLSAWKLYNLLYLSNVSGERQCSPLHAIYCKHLNNYLRETGVWIYFRTGWGKSLSHNNQRRRKFQWGPVDHDYEQSWLFFIKCAKSVWYGETYNPLE